MNYRRSAAEARNSSILHAIVQTYIETGEPVASRTIAKAHGGDISAATIRNIMADLCDEGYLAQPHTSAGRVPTEKAFRSYVQSLAIGRIGSPEVQRLIKDLRRADSMESRIERTSHLLTQLSHGMGIAAAIPAKSQVLSQIELVSLADRRVLMVVVLSDGLVRNRVVTLDRHVDQDQLNSIRNYVNQHFGGWVLARVQAELQRRLAAESAVYDDILRQLNVLYDKGLLDVGVAPEIHMEGASNLFALDLHLTRERLRELFQALEEKKKMLQLLERFLNETAVEEPQGVTIRVGLAEAHPAMQDLSLIGITVALPGGLFAKVAVLGPMRMNYEKAISAVLHVGQAFRHIPV